MLRVVVDVTFLHDQYANRGIGRYGREIVKGLIHSQHVEVTLIGFSNIEENRFLLDVEENSFNFISLGQPRLSNPVDNIRLYPRMKALLEQLEFDIFFAAHFERGVPSNQSYSSAVMIHDLIPLENNAFSRKGMLVNWLKGAYYKTQMRRAIRADILLCPSQATKSTLIEYFPNADHKARVVPHGLSNVFRQEIDTKKQLEILEKYGLDDHNYFIYDSGLEQNKNTDYLLEILNHLEEYQLVKVGSDFLDGIPQNDGAESFWSTVTRMELENRVVTTGRVTDAELVSLTSGATAYINLSSAEGFGFGPLQAMVLGTPAIISDIPVYREISGWGSLLIDLNKPANYNAEQIKRVLTDQKLVSAMQAKGKEHAMQFTWEKSVTNTIELLNNVKK